MTRSECLGLRVKVRVSRISVRVRVLGLGRVGGIIYLSEETLAPSEVVQILPTWLIEFHDKTKTTPLSFSRLSIEREARIINNQSLSIYCNFSSNEKILCFINQLIRTNFVCWTTA